MEQLLLEQLQLEQLLLEQLQLEQLLLEQLLLEQLELEQLLLEQPRVALARGSFNSRFGSRGSLIFNKDIIVQGSLS